MQLRPAEAKELVLPVHEEEAARVEPGLLDRLVEICSRHAALIGVCGEGPGVDLEPGLGISPVVVAPQLDSWGYGARGRRREATSEAVEDPGGGEARNRGSQLTAHGVEPDLKALATTDGQGAGQPEQPGLDLIAQELELEGAAAAASPGS